MTGRMAAAGWAALGAGGMALALLATGVWSIGGAGGGDGDDGPAPAEAAAPVEQDGLLRLPPAQRARAGLRLTALASGDAPAVRPGFARALDLSSLAGIEADRAAARAALQASQAQAARLAALAAQDESASRQAVEAARAQAVADAARLALAERRVGLEFGAGLARLGAGELRALLAGVAAGRAALLRVEVPGAALRPGAVVTVDDGARTQRVTLLGPASATDPAMQTAAMLAILRGPMADAAVAGRQLTVSAPAAGRATGLIVPRPAPVRWQGRLWVYRAEGAGAGGFRRVPLDGARPVAAGWLVAAGTGGLRAGDRVVTDGAETLLALELGGAAEQEDE